MVQAGGGMSQNNENIDVAGLAAIINSRLAAEARVARAIGFGWLCGGVAVMSMLSAFGAALALYGYSYMVSIKPAAEQTVAAVVSALERAKLQTTISGTVSLSQNSELKLAAGQTVKLAEGTILKLDPNSSVRVVGDVKVPQPSAYQLQKDEMNGDQLPFTTYTIFRSVSFGAGRVETGWNFSLSDTSRPKTQYCSYIQSIAKGADVKDIIAIDGQARRNSGRAAQLPFNFEGAVSNCIWFSGT